MKEAIIIHVMKDGSILHSNEELAEYGKTHELPALTKDIICKMMSKDEERTA